MAQNISDDLCISSRRTKKKKSQMAGRAVGLERPTCSSDTLFIPTTIIKKGWLRLLNKKRAKRCICGVKVISVLSFLKKGLQQIRETNRWLTGMWKLPEQQFMTRFLSGPRYFIYIHFLYVITACCAEVIGCAVATFAPSLNRKTASERH